MEKIGVSVNLLGKQVGVGVKGFCEPSNIIVDGLINGIVNENVASGDTYKICIINSLGNKVGVVALGNLSSQLNLQI